MIPYREGKKSLPGHVYYLSAAMSIHPKLETGKYQNDHCFLMASARMLQAVTL